MSDEYIFLNKFAGLEEYNDCFRPVKPYQSFVRFFETGIIDRTETLDFGFKYRVLDPLPTLTDGLGFMDFEQLIKGRANDAARIASDMNRPINVLWSGGIDSTAVLIAMIQEMSEVVFKKEATISLTIGSIFEFPEFYEHLLKKGFNFRLVSHPVSKYISHDSLNISGEHGDQLFGSDKMIPFVDAGLGDISYQKAIPLLMMDKLSDTDKVDALLAFIAPVMNKSPYPIVNICDYLWWINFVFKWQQVSLRIPAWTFGNVKGSYDSLFHFYRSNNFQKWSMSQTNKNPGKSTKYKMPLKLFIKSHFDCESYFQNKTKEISLRPKGEKKYWHLNRNKWSIIIDSEWNLNTKQIVNYIL
jgi:hypothetical protein